MEKVFLTNRFDEDLSAVDRTMFVPCLRTDDLVFQVTDAEVRRRLAAKTGKEIGSLDELRDAVRWLMRYFIQHGAASAAISLPPASSRAPDESAAEKALDAGRAGEGPGGRREGGPGGSSSSTSWPTVAASSRNRSS